MEKLNPRLMRDEPLPSAFSLCPFRSRGAIISAPRFERGGCRWDSCREHHLRRGARIAERGMKTGSLPLISRVAFPVSRLLAVLAQLVEASRSEREG